MKTDNIFIYSSHRTPIDETDYEAVERKGLGHPDSICDGIAESISRAFSQYCLKRYGVILRHMLDKVAMQGGSSHVEFGSGEMLKPVTLFLNGRFTRTYRGKEIPYFEIAAEAAREHLKTILPLLDLDRWLVIVNNVHFSQGPGVVYGKDGSTRNERRYFFSIPKKEYLRYHDNGLRSNDTSTCVAYAPLSSLEKNSVAGRKYTQQPHL